MKELIIIVYKISVAGLTRQQAEQSMSQIIAQYNLTEDLELKANNYLIREIWLPLGDGGETDVKVIYPITQNYSFTPEVNDLVAEISDKIKNDPTNGFRTQWNRLVRELKLIKISSTI
jgi:hypothetical protein